MDREYESKSLQYRNGESTLAEASNQRLNEKGATKWEDYQ